MITLILAWVAVGVSGLALTVAFAALRVARRTDNRTAYYHRRDK